MHYLYLAGAIIAEVIGTSALQASASFTKTVPSIITTVSYMAAFYLLSLALPRIPLGIAYAIWSGVGIVLIALVGLVLYKQRLDAWALVGIGLIVAGVLVMNLLSKSVRH